MQENNTLLSTDTTCLLAQAACGHLLFPYEHFTCSFLFINGFHGFLFCLLVKES